MKTCGDGTFLGCSAETLPWVIAGLIALVVLLLAFRAGLSLRERWGRPPAEPPAPERPQREVRPGDSVQPPAQAQQQSRHVPRQPQRPSPLQFQIADRPDVKITDFTEATVQGDFGDMLTSIVLAQDGWIKLGSKFGQDGRGIDGLFVREVRGGGGFEALAVETKTNEARYDPASMADDKLARDVEALFAQGAFGRSANEAIARELVRGIYGGPPFFRKELWRHNLATGLTAITQLGANGEQRNGSSRSYARLTGALFMSLKQLDRTGTYVGPAPLDDSR